MLKIRFQWIVLAFALLPVCSLFSQSYQGKVLDASDRSPISYVNIGITKDARGTVSDDDGHFVLDFKNEDEIITFSAIGYESYNVEGKQLLQDSVILLEHKTYNIPTIKVVAQRLGEEKVFGVRNKTRGQSIAYGSYQLGSEIGSVIRIKKKTAIYTANFVLNHAKGDSMLFRVKVYEYTDGKIGNQLLTENIYIRDKQRKGTLTVDLKDQNLVLESDVLLALEWLRDYDELGNKGITFDTGRGKNPKGIYLKKTSNTAFEKIFHVSGKNVCFYFIGRESE